MRGNRLLVGSIVAATIFLLTQGGFAESPFRMIGQVTDADSGEPVAGATAQAFVESAAPRDQWILKAQTNAQGCYVLDLPAGDAKAWTLQPPAGYFLPTNIQQEAFATTPERPVFEKDYQVRKGIGMRVAVWTDSKTLGPARIYGSLVEEPANDRGPYDLFFELDAQGAGTLAVPNRAGAFNLNFGDINDLLNIRQTIKLRLDQGFDPAHVSEIKQLPDGSTEVRDTSGRKAICREVRAVADEHGLLLQVDATLWDVNRLHGTVADEQGQAIESALVSVAMYYVGGASSSTNLNATTDRDGRFTLKVPKWPEIGRLSLVSTKDGFAGHDTKPYSVDLFKDGDARVEKVVLHRGSSLPARVVDADGIPLHGAVIEPMNDYAQRTRIARTDARGECLLTNLPAGLTRLHIRFGQLGTETRVLLEHGENEVVVLKLSPPAAQAQAAPPDVMETATRIAAGIVGGPEAAAVAKAIAELPVEIKIGTTLPDWTVSEWTDGKAREVADYRGKVVVLDFWGVWCSPCVHAITAMKQLDEQFKNREVVFLSIHTAGTDISLVRRLLKQLEWNVPAGLDAGTDVATGATVHRYNIQGFPTVVILDRGGKVFFTSADESQGMDVAMREMEELAKDANIPWPIEYDATPAEIEARMTSLQVAMFGRRIEQALK